MAQIFAKKLQKLQRCFTSCLKNDDESQDAQSGNYFFNTVQCAILIKKLLIAYKLGRRQKGAAGAFVLVKICQRVLIDIEGSL